MNITFYACSLETKQQNKANRPNKKERKKKKNIKQWNRITNINFKMLNELNEKTVVKTDGNWTENIKESFSIQEKTEFHILRISVYTLSMGMVT